MGIRIAAALALAVLLTLGAAGARAGEPPAPARPELPDPDPDRPPPEPPPPPPPPGWIDETHALVEQELGGMTGWVDGFFGDERDADLAQASSLVRWRNELRFDDRWRTSARTRLLAAVALPALERRLARASLVFTGETVADPSRGLSDDRSFA